MDMIGPKVSLEESSFPTLNDLLPESHNYFIMTRYHAKRKTNKIANSKRKLFSFELKEYGKGQH